MGSFQRPLKQRHWPAWLCSIALLGAIVSGWPGTALAQPQSQNSVAAEALFAEGQALMDAKKYAEACAKFESSFAVDESGGTLLNLARCNELRGRSASAWVNYRRAASSLRANDPRRADFASKKADALQPKLSRLSISVVAVPGLSVTRNGAQVVAATWGTPLPVDPGTQRIEASAPGYQSWSGSIDVAGEAATAKLTIPELKPLAGSAADRGSAGDLASNGDETATNGLLIGGVVVAAAGAATMIVGGVMGGIVLGDASAARDDPSLCPASRCTPAGLEAIEDAKSKATVADILLAVGGGATALGTGLLIVGLVSAEPASPTVQLEPSVGPQGGFVSLRARF